MFLMLPRFFLGIALCALIICQAVNAAQPSFLNFESGHVRPLAMSPDGNRLFAVNTPDSSLQVFDLSNGGLTRIRTIPVGLEPVAVAARSENEVWVVNHLSDSVSIVDVEMGVVVRTLLVGDEPRDLVFAGPNRSRAFITTAHRGQHRTHRSLALVPGAGDPQLTTPGVPRADVWVFDADDPGGGIGGAPLKIVELFGDTPRSLAVSPDGNTVYAAIFHSGNQTAVVSEGIVCDGFEDKPCPGDNLSSPNGLPLGWLPGGNPGPATNWLGDSAPEVGLIVKFDEASGQWRDERGRNWSNGIRFFVPDLDVFAIDAVTLREKDRYAHVGTTLFNMVVNPVTGSLYVSNTDAQNLTRFEGPGDFGGSTVQGNIAQTRITVIDGQQVRPRHLNRHIDYSQLARLPDGSFNPGFDGDARQHSLAIPTGMEVSSDGAVLYVAAFGSGKVGVFDTADLGDDRLWNGVGDEFDPKLESAHYLSVSGGGPSGLALDEARGRLYVMTRFDNGISVLDLADGSELQHLRMYSPEPRQVVNGRRFLYDAFTTSANGEASCASCHVFGDFDGLAWDLGNPDEAISTSPIPINNVGPGLLFLSTPINGTGNLDDFHPMKGPMTTQTLRGLANSGAMHWRGDRSNGLFGIDAYDSRLSFRNFIVAFTGLLGRAELLDDQAMRMFTDFGLSIALPPNPIRRLDNSLTPEQQAGQDFYLGLSVDFADGSPDQNTAFTCEGCHRLDPMRGFFGTGGNQAFAGGAQIIKVPQLRNLYQKIGAFGMPKIDFIPRGNNQHQGKQIRGTGFLHDGAVDTLFRFFSGVVFDGRKTLRHDIGFVDGDRQRRQVEQYMMAFDADLAPIVGQQVTFDVNSSYDTFKRIDLLTERAATPFTSKILGGNVTECDLIAKGNLNGRPRGYLYDPAVGAFRQDREQEPLLSLEQLLDQVNQSGVHLTFTCVLPGAGVRMGIDRDLDGILDGDEAAG